MYGPKTALVDLGGRSYSYRDVDLISSSSARKLMKLGVRKGDRVVVISQSKAAVVILYFACQKIGAILVPSNIRLSDREILETVSKVTPKIIVVSDSLSYRYRELIARAGIRSEVLEEIEKGKEEDELELEDQDLESPSMILFTGGTTGEPKGAVLSNRAIIFNALNTVLSWKLSERDKTVLVYPLFHTGGWNVLTIPLLICGGSVIMIEKFDASLVLRTIEEMKVTAFSGVPAMVAQISESEYFERAELSSLRFVKSGGGTTPENVAEKFRKKRIKFYQGYGLTEAGPNLFYSSDEDLAHPYSLGRKSLFVDLRLIDEEGNESDEGELLVRGPITFSGYFEEPEKTSETVVNGSVRTGDVLRRDRDGFYYFVGRKKFMYKSGGENVYPSEVEKVLESYPNVVESAVIGVPDEKWGEVGIAYIEVRGELNLEDMKNWLFTKIAKYEIPKYFKIVDSIPKTGAGKKDYTLLRRWFDG